MSDKKKFLLVLGVLFLVATIACAIRLMSAAKDSQLATSFQARGAEIFYDYEYDPYGKEEIPPPGFLWALLSKFVGEDTARHLFYEVRYIDLVGSGFGNKDLAALTRFRNVRVMGFRNTSITDEGLPSLSSFPHLHHLVLDSTSISVHGLNHLAACPKLRTLCVCRSSTISDADLLELRIGDFKSLTEVAFYDTPVSNKGKILLEKNFSGLNVTVQQEAAEYK